MREIVQDTFIVRVRGESMAGLGIHDGYEIVFRATNQYKNGDIVLARLGDEFTIKQIKNGNGYTLLNPANPDFEAIRITSELDFEVQGVKIKVMF
jgi:repressor LexA